MEDGSEMLTVDGIELRWAVRGDRRGHGLFVRRTEEARCEEEEGEQEREMARRLGC